MKSKLNSTEISVLTMKTSIQNREVHGRNEMLIYSDISSTLLIAAMLVLVLLETLVVKKEQQKSQLSAAGR